MLCPNGHENVPGAAFCNQCGAAMTAAGAGQTSGSFLTSVDSRTGATRPDGRGLSRTVLAACGILALGLGAVALWLTLGSSDGGEGAKATDSASATGEESSDLASEATETMTVQGTITLPGGCGSQTNSSYGFDDEPMQYSVQDNAGDILAFGTLAEGKELGTDVWNPEGCEYSFQLDDVPAEGDIYSLVFGMRAPHQFTKDEAAEPMEFSLGF